MNDKVLKTLEYYKIIDRLSEFCGSSLGKEKAKSLMPCSDIHLIREKQKETSDALTRIYKKGSLSFSGIPDIRDSIKRLEIEGTLTAAELLRISSVLTAALRIKSYGYAGSEDETMDSLSERFSLLEPMSPLNNEIMRCIISEEEIADDASAGLKSVRRQIRISNDKIHEHLNSILTGSGKTMLQETLVTMRNGRYCLPVKLEHKNQFGGMIHDQSSSGATVFIEPSSVVRLNNELTELAIKEKAEIEKILAYLSGMAGEQCENLSYNISTMAEFDFIFAKGMLSKQMKASEPQYNDKRYFNIKKGRHPLIDPHIVVPIDVYLGDEFDLLIITGPNTGGKTVTLKTVGLFALMGQAGLHIPAFDGSMLSVFDEVYADIGDEQSIEQSLSTFSSHMKNTVYILEHAKEDSLVLFDELGAGTDPIEGAALAMAVLTHLHQKGVRTIGTTHYSELKVFALQTERVSNACCEFSVETLKPTYRLLIGIPGRSNAFAIATKLGLSQNIVETAKGFIGTKEESFEDVISELESTRTAIEEDRKLTKDKLEEAERINKKLIEKNERIDKTRENIINEANEAARKILQNAKDYADETIRKFNHWSTEGFSLKEMELERSALRDKLGDTASTSFAERKKKNKGRGAATELKLGESVHVLSLNLKGTVSTLPNAKGELYVQMGILRSLVHVNDIEPVEDNEKSKPEKGTSAGRIKADKTYFIRPELNIIGKRVDEALPILDKYIDDAYLAHLPKVTIIHGRGTGALRDAVHQHLKKLKHISSYRVGGFGEGDHGVTIVELQ